MIMKVLCSFIIGMQIVMSSFIIELKIEKYTNQIIALESEIAEAQKVVGLAETMEYVEKLGLVEQLKAEVERLKEEKERLIVK